MRLWLARPDCDSASKILGFAVPQQFADHLARIHIHARGRSSKCPGRFSDCLGIYLTDWSFNYLNTPPELFTVATLGVDGVHFGYVIHAPELTARDYPAGEFSPMDDAFHVLALRGRREVAPAHPRTFARSRWRSSPGCASDSAIPVGPALDSSNSPSFTTTQRRHQRPTDSRNAILPDRCLRAGTIPAS